MAEIILKSKLKRLGVKGITVKSAGLSTEDGLKMSENSATALKLLGYKPYGFKSKQVTKEMLEKSDLILCMTTSHKAYLAGYNAHTIAEATGQIEDVIDPYGGNINVYIRTSHQLEDACNIIIEKILEAKGE